MALSKQEQREKLEQAYTNIAIVREEYAEGTQNHKLLTKIMEAFDRFFGPTFYLTNTEEQEKHQQ